MNEVNWMQQGWECPKCGAVMSPTTSCCVNCRGNKGGGTATTITTTPNQTFRTAEDFEHWTKSTSGRTSEDPEEQWDRYQLNV